MVEKLFNDIFLDILKLKSKYGDIIFWSIIFGLIPILLKPSARSFFMHIVSIFISVVVGLLIGIVCYEFKFELGATYVIVSIAALISNHIILFILAFFDFLRENETEIFKSILRSVCKKLGIKHKE